MQYANCCKTIGSLCTDKDIERIPKHLKRKVAVFEDQSSHTDEDQDEVLQNLPSWFLNEDNSCSIYEVRPKACRGFPHTVRKKIIRSIINMMICPAAFEFVERLQKNLGKK